jgi:heptosyltransferase-2
MRRAAPRRALVFTAAWSGPLAARISGAPLRMGWAGGGGSRLLTHALDPGDRSSPLWNRYLRLARFAGGEPEERPNFRLDPGPEAAGRAGELLASARGEPVALAPGAAYGPAKQWPIDYFEELARSLRERGYAPVVVGGDQERETGRRLAAVALDLTGSTGLLEAVAVLARCRAVVSNDSGALHLARAAGTRVIGLFGSSSPAWTGPTPAEGEVLRLGLSCSPCYRRTCPLSGEAHMACLRGIRPEVVLGRVLAGEDA